MPLALVQMPAGIMLSGQASGRRSGEIIWEK